MHIIISEGRPIIRVWNYIFILNQLNFDVDQRRDHLKIK